MKSISNVYKNLLNKEVIKDIIVKASKGKRKRREVKMVLENIDFYADKILEMLCNKTYYMSPSHHKTICERGKYRDLTISPFYPNRILDYVIVETLKPYIRKSMYIYCIGNVDGKGMMYGKKVITRKYQKYEYYLKLDIHHFYPSVTSKELLKFIRKKVRDNDFYDLCDVVVGATDDMPIGSYYSQWFSNWLLEELDHKIKEEWGIEFYVRYVDDMLLMSNNKRKLLNAMYNIGRWLNVRGLELKRYERIQTLERPIDFLGFRFTYGKIYLRTKNFKNINKKVRKIRKCKHISVSQARSLLSCVGWLKQIDEGYIYYQKYIRPYVKLGTLKAIVSMSDKKHNCSTERKGNNL